MINLFARGALGEMLFAELGARGIPAQIYTYAQTAQRRKTDLLYLKDGYPVRYIHERSYDPKLITFGKADMIFCIDWTKDFFHKIDPGVPVFIIHPALLPKYRGYGAISEQFLKGVCVSGLTVCRDDPVTDAGDIVYREEIRIAFNDYPLDFMKKCAYAAGGFIQKIYREIFSLTPEKQNEEYATSVQRTRAKHGQLDFNAGAIYVYNMVRAFSHPYFGAYFYASGERVTVFKVQCEKWAGIYAEPGVIINKDRNGVEIACGEGSVLLTQIQYGDRIFEFEDIQAVPLFNSGRI